MTERSGSVNVVKVALKRADVTELITKDSLLAGAAVVKLLGGPASDVLRGGVLRRFPDKGVLFQQGELGQSVFFVIAGEVRIFARRDHELVDLGLAPRGATVGEREVMDDAGPRACSAVAQGQVDVLELQREALARGGHLPLPLVNLFGAVWAERRKALDEMSDFLNRW